jgi:hypothetical protein
MTLLVMDGAQAAALLGGQTAATRNALSDPPALVSFRLSSPSNCRSRRSSVLGSDARRPSNAAQNHSRQYVVLYWELEERKKKAESLKASHNNGRGCRGSQVHGLLKWGKAG